MNKWIFLLILIPGIFVACDNDQDTSPQFEMEPTAIDSIENYRGDFISAGDEAVLKGDQFIYQVEMDSMGKLLKDSIQNYELDDNFTPVEVTGKVIDNPKRTGYSKMIQIKEIEEISAEKKAENNEEQ